MNSFFASCEQQLRPELRGVPVGIAPVEADTTCCIAASYEAKASGVKTGTGVAEARQICPNIQIVQARPSLYREMHYKIVDAVERVAPVYEVLSVDEMVISPWANERTVQDCLRTGQSISDSIRYEVGECMTCSVGIAPNAFLAKVAGDLQKPRGLSIVTQEDIPHKFNKLALNDWPGIARGMKRRFEAHGVVTTKQMYNLTLSEMRTIFDSINGERWYRLIRGEAVEMPAIKKWQVGHSNVLAPEFRNLKGSWSIACRLIEKAGERLRKDELHASRVYASVGSYTGQGWSRAIRITPTDRTYRFLDALRLIWLETVHNPSHVSVALQNVAPAHDSTLDLFPDDALDERRLDGVMDQINRRFGRGTITTMTALSSKDYLSHNRIPFGKITELR